MSTIAENLRNLGLEGRVGNLREERAASFGRTALWVMLTGACYYVATRIAWALCFPDSKVSLFFPPHAVLVSVLLLVPTRHWWAYTLAAVCSHFVATQQANWPPLYALHCEVFDGVQNVAAAAGLRIFIKSPFKSITLRDAIIFVLITVVIVPFGSAFWGAAFTLSNGFGTHYWVEWRNLGVSNAVTSIVLVPAILLGFHHLTAQRINATPARLLEAGLLGASILTAGVFAFDKSATGPTASPVLLYASIPLLIWAALRFGLGGVSASTLVVTFQAIWGTMHGRGPFLTQTPAENALMLQIFLLVMAIPLMFLAVVVEEEKRSKDALSESEARMTLATEAAHLGVWTRDLARNKVWASDKWRALFGFTPSEPLHFDDFFKRLHPDDRDRVRSALENAPPGDGYYETEFRVVLPDGQIRWITSRGRVDSDGAGKPVRARGVSADITPRMWAEEALRESEARFRTMADTTPVLIWMSGTDKLCTFCNRKWLEFTGRTLEHELGNGWAEGLHREDFDRCLQVYASSFDARQDFTMEYRLRRRDATYGWVLATGVPRFAPDGTFLGYVGSCVEITQRKQAEEQLMLSKEFKRAVLDSIDANIAVLDDQGVIVAVNARWQQFVLENPAGTGEPARHIGVGVNYLELDCQTFGWSAESAQAAHDGIRSVLNGSVHKFAMEYACDSRHPARWFSMSVTPLSQAERSVVVSHSDITGRKQAELELAQQREDLIHLSRVTMLGELSGSLAHELNQPLAAILRNAEAAGLFLQDPSPDLDEVRAILTDIRNDDARAGAVIHRMRALLKRREVQHSLLDLSQLTAEVISLVRPDADARKVRLTIEPGSPVPAAWGDRVQLQQVLLNLLLNAMDAVNDRALESRRVIVRLQSARAHVEVAVSDTGHGIPPERLPRLFEPFFTTKPTGMGMGLSISRTIVEAHRGRIWAENNPAGATFKFTVPLAKDEHSGFRV